MKAVVAAFNQEKALVGAFSVITNLRMELFEALTPTPSHLVQQGGGRHYELGLTVHQLPVNLLCNTVKNIITRVKISRVFHTGSVGGVEGGHAEASLGGAQHHEGVPAMVVMVIIIIIMIIIMLSVLVPTPACWAV